MFTNSPRIRQVIYGLALAAQIASFFVSLFDAALADAFVATAGVLATVAGVTALSNISPDVRSNGLGGTAPDIEG